MPFSCHLSRNKLYLLRQSILSKLKNKSLVHCHTCGCTLWILDNLMRFNSSLGVKTIPMPHSYSVHSFTVGFLWPGSTYCWQIKVFWIGIKSETGYVGHWWIHHSILSFNDNCYEKLAHNSIFQWNIFMQR